MKKLTLLFMAIVAFSLFAANTLKELESKSNNDVKIIFMDGIGQNHPLLPPAGGSGNTLSYLPLFDTYDSAIYAFSAYQLHADATDSAFLATVQGGATEVIGFVNGAIDTGAIRDFAISEGVTEVYVKTFFNQARDEPGFRHLNVSAPYTSTMCRVFTSGDFVFNSSGRLSFYWDGGDRYALDFTSLPGTLTEATLITRGDPDGLAKSFYTNSNADVGALHPWSGDNKFYDNFFSDVRKQLGGSGNADTNEYCIVHTGDSLRSWYNGNFTSSQSANFDNMSSYVIGGMSYLSWSGTMDYMIIFRDDKTVEQANLFSDLRNYPSESQVSYFLEDHDSAVVAYSLYQLHPESDTCLVAIAQNGQRKIIGFDGGLVDTAAIRQFADQIGIQTIKVEKLYNQARNEPNYNDIHFAFPNIGASPTILDSAKWVINDSGQVCLFHQVGNGSTIDLTSASFPPSSASIFTLVEPQNIDKTGFVANDNSIGDTAALHPWSDGKYYMSDLLTTRTTGLGSGAITFEHKNFSSHHDGSIYYAYNNDTLIDTSSITFAWTSRLAIGINDNGKKSFEGLFGSFLVFGTDKLNERATITNDLADLTAAGYTGNPTVVDAGTTGGSGGVGLSRPDSGTVMTFTPWTSYIIYGDEVFDGDYYSAGPGALLDTNTDNTIAFKGSYAAYGKLSVDFFFGETTRLRGVRIKGSNGGSHVTFVKSNDGYTYNDTIEIGDTTVLSAGYNWVIAANIDDTTRFLRAYLEQGNWPRHLTLYNDTEYSDYTYTPPAPTAPFPYQTVGQLISANTFPDDETPQYVAFGDSALHRNYVNQDWYMSGNGLPPNDLYAFDPMYGPGNMDNYLQDINELGQGVYISSKSLSSSYGWTWIKKDINNVPVPFDLNLAYGPEDGATVIRVKVEPADSMLYHDSNGSTGGCGSCDSIHDTTLYMPYGTLSYLTYKMTNEGGVYKVRQLDTIEVLNGKTEFAIYTDERENVPLDNYYGNPHSYENYQGKASEAFQVVARYGNVVHPDNVLKIDTTSGSTATKKSGLGLIKGYQAGNELNKYWRGKDAYLRPEWAHFYHKPVYDTVKDADSSMIVLSQGHAGYSNWGYWLHWSYIEKVRAEMCDCNTQSFDVLAYHAYPTSLGATSNQEGSSDRYGITPDDANFYEVLDSVSAFTRRIFPNAMNAIDEYGYDTKQAIFGYDSVENKIVKTGGKQAIPDSSGGFYTDNQIQAGGLFRIFTYVTSTPNMLVAPFYLIRNPGVVNAATTYSTSGIVEKGSFYQKDSWFMTHNFTERLESYVFYERVQVGNPHEVYIVKYVNTLDSTEFAYSIWKSSSMFGEYSSNYPVYVGSDAAYAYQNYWKYGEEMGHGSELTITDHDSVILDSIPELGMLLFTKEDTTLSENLSIPFKLQTLDAKDDSVLISWKNFSSNINAQRLYFQDSISSGWDSIDISPLVRSYWLDNLDPDMRGMVALANVNSDGIGVSSDTMVIKTNATGWILDTVYKIDFNRFTGSDNTHNGWLDFNIPQSVSEPYNKKDTIDDNLYSTIEAINFYSSSNSNGPNYKDAGDPEWKMKKDFWRNKTTVQIVFDSLETNARYTMKIYCGSAFEEDPHEVSITSSDGQITYARAQQKDNEYRSIKQIKTLDGSIIFTIKIYPQSLSTGGVTNGIILEKYVAPE